MKTVDEAIYNNIDGDNVELVNELDDVFVNRITAKDLIIYSRDHGIKEPTLDDLSQAKYLKNTSDDKKFNSHLLVFIAVTAYGEVLKARTDDNIKKWRNTVECFDAAIQSILNNLLRSSLCCSGIGIFSH